MGTRQGCERATVICDIGSNAQSLFALPFLHQHLIVFYIIAKLKQDPLI